MNDSGAKAQSQEWVERIARLERRNTLLEGIVVAITLGCVALGGFGYWMFREGSRQRQELAADLAMATRNFRVSEPIPAKPSSSPLPAPVVATPVVTKLSIPDALEVKSIAIKDASGRIRYKVGLDANGNVTQSFHDDKGQIRLSSALSDSGEPNQTFYDQKGVSRVRTQVRVDGNASQVLFNAAAKPQLSAVVAPSISTYALSGTNGNLRYYVHVDESEVVRQWFADRNGTARAVMTSGDDNLPMQSFYDSQMRTRVQTIITREGIAAFSVHDTNQIPRVITHTLNDEAGQIFRDAKETERFQISTDRSRVALEVRDEKGKLRDLSR